MNLETKINLMNKYKKLPAVKEALETRDALLKSIPKSSLRQFEIHLTEHCNLNCKGCDNFSPLAETEFINANWMRTQMHRMSELFNGYVANINLMGGEPLLHPDLPKLMKLTREEFPFVEIDLLTNGMLIPARGKEFFDSCRENNIIVSITKYPVVKTYNKIEKLLMDNEVKFNYFNKDPLHHIYKTPIDIEGKCDGTRMFYKCFRSAHCVQIRDGRLYPCSVAPNMRHFKKYFELDHLCEVEEDSIDIFTHNRKEIFEFLSRPIPMCRFCNLDDMQYGIPFDKSERVITEWV